MTATMGQPFELFIKAHCMASEAIVHCVGKNSLSSTYCGSAGFGRARSRTFRINGAEA